MRDVRAVLPVIAIAAGCGRIDFDDRSTDASAVTVDAPYAPYRFVQNTETFNTCQQFTQTVAFSQDVEAGDLIVVEFDYEFGTAIAGTVTDTLASPFAVAVPPDDAIAGYRQYLNYGIAPATGADSVTVTLGDNCQSFFEIRVLEYSGVTTLDVISTSDGSGNAGDVATATPITTTAAGELLIGAVIGRSGTIAGGAGFEVRSSLLSDIIEDQLTGAPGSYQVVADLGAANTTWSASTAAFR
jgi:hypothetical protein